MIRFENHSYEENALVKQVTWHHRNKENKNNKTIMCVGVQVQLFRQKVLDPVIHHFGAHNNYLRTC